MDPPRESSLRDALANRLELIEPGLQLVETEHRLPNPFGAKGFIDILATDQLGNRVIIELKRSDQTARQAIHEILKYAALLTLNRGLPAHKIRCLIVSTDWHELAIPFAEFLRVSDFQLEGYKLAIGDSGLEAATRFEPPPLSAPIACFRNHDLYLFRNREARDEAIARITEAVACCGAETFACVCLDYEGGQPHIIYPFAVYVVPMRLKAECSRRMESLAAEEIADSVDEYSAEEKANVLEEVFSFRVGEELVDLHSTYGTGYTFEIGHPEKFTGMLSTGWATNKLFRFGSIDSPAAATDDEIVSMIRGIEGQSDIRFCRVATPRVPLDWDDMQEKADRCLSGNDAWSTGFRWFCDRVRNESESAVLSCNIYNPLCLPISLYKMVEYGDHRFLPTMELIARCDSTGIVLLLAGILTWDGFTKPFSLKDVLSPRYRDFEEFLLASHMGAVWESDAEIVSKNGMAYSLRLGIASPSSSTVNWMEPDGQLVRDASERLDLSVFGNHNNEYLDDLRQVIRDSQFGL